MMGYDADYWGYELGSFLPPEEDPIGAFFILLQNPLHYKENVESFTVKLGKYRFLDGKFKISCQKVLVYWADIDCFTTYDIELKEKKDGTKYFDAVLFLNTLGLKYRENNTQHYRYFKSRLRDIRSEIILKKDTKKVSFIHRRINADDYEKLQTYSCRVSDTLSRPLSIAENGFYFFIHADDHIMYYHELVYYPSEEEMLDYLKAEYMGTDGEAITKYSLKQLLAGVEYQQSHRMGCNTSKVYCRMFHGDLGKLYAILDEAELFDSDETPVRLSDYLIDAENKSDIREIVDAYNESWDNFW